eukprot:gene8027-9872_t
MDSSQKWVFIGKDFIAGSCGGMASCFAGHPFDTIKVMLQDGSGNVPKFKNGYQALRYTLQSDGIRGVYRGLSVPLVSVSIINSIFFATNNFCQKQLHPSNDTLIPLYKAAICGGVAGGVISFFITPRDLIKQKLQIQCKRTTIPGGNQQYIGPIDSIKQIIQKNGPLGMFKGLRSTLCRDIPGDMVYFTVYEFIKRNLISLSNSFKKTDDDNSNITNSNNNNNNKINYTSIPSWVAIGAGGCAGMSFWASIYPLDVIKTRIQTQPDTQPPQYTSVLQCAKKIYKTEGFNVFYRGFSATILRAFPTSAVNFFVYESIKSILHSQLSNQSVGLEAT